jgi:hypothetical protein
MKVHWEAFVDGWDGQKRLSIYGTNSPIQALNFLGCRQVAIK